MPKRIEALQSRNVIFYFSTKDDVTHNYKNWILVVRLRSTQEICSCVLIGMILSIEVINLWMDSLERNT